MYIYVYRYKCIAAEGLELAEVHHIHVVPHKVHALSIRIARVCFDSNIGQCCAYCGAVVRVGSSASAQDALDLPGPHSRHQYWSMLRILRCPPKTHLTPLETAILVNMRNIDQYCAICGQRNMPCPPKTHLTYRDPTRTTNHSIGYIRAIVEYNVQCTG